MISIRCNLDQFNFNKQVNHSKQELDDFARSITWDIRALLQGVKYVLNTAITTSAAFVVLEENLREFVRNSLDAFKQCHHSDWLIMIKIPINSDKNHNATLIYLDTAGGFPKKFFNGKSCIDYYNDLLTNNQIFILSEKNSKTDLGGCGIALSQTSRFLHKQGGSLKVDNTPQGARLQLISPVNTEGSPKPSFNRFRGIDYENFLAEIDKKSEQRVAAFEVESKKSKSCPISQNNFLSVRAIKAGLTPLILPEINSHNSHRPIALGH